MENDASRAAARPRVVIVGAGFAGMRAAMQLAGKAVDVTLVDRRNHHTFQPLLYQVALAALSPADIAQPIRAIFRNQRNIDVLMDEELEAVEEQNNEIVLAKLRKLIDDRQFVSLPTQRAMCAYAIEAIPELEEFTDEFIRSEIQAMTAKIQARGLKRR